METKGDNSQELDKLKKELTNLKLKSNSQQEINSLKTQLQQAKTQEQLLTKKIKGLLAKKAKENIEEEIVSNNSYWGRIKTPLYFGGTIIAIILVISYFKGNKN